MLKRTPPVKAHKLDIPTVDDEIEDIDFSSIDMEEGVRISPPNMRRVRVTIEGTAPLMIARLSAKTQGDLLAKFTQDEAPAEKRKKRRARNLDEDMENAIHRSEEGWPGFAASAIRKGMISACRVANFKMTLAKLSLFTEAEGYDVVDGMPLCQIHGPYERNILAVRNATGVIDLRTRPMWKPGWHANLVLRFDADQFTISDVVNLLARVGEQVGVGEGRADSTNSAGIGFGFFKLRTGGSE